MSRTTLNIDTPLLEELRGLQKEEGKSLGDIVSELVAEALAHRGRPPEPRTFHWTTRKMGARIDISDKEALYAALDQPAHGRKS